MPAMPLLSRRRSLLDLLNASNDELQRRFLKPEQQTDQPRPKSEYGYPRSSLSHEVSREEVADPEPASNDVRGRNKRFSMLKLRNFSEPQLPTIATFNEQKEEGDVPPVPAVPSNTAVPAIVKTAPTMDHFDPQEVEGSDMERERKSRTSFFKRSMSKGRSPDKREPRKSSEAKRREKNPTSLRWRKMQGRSTGLEDLQRLAAAHAHHNQVAPPSYGDESNSELALPVSGHRLSESSRSEGSNGSDQIYGATTTTTHTVSTHTTFFKLPRRNKNRNSLFPLPVKIPPPQEESQPADGPPTPRASTSAISTKSQQSAPNGRTVPQRRHTETTPNKRPPLPPNAALAKGSLSFAEPGMNLFRNDSQRSRGSSNSSPLQPPMRLGMRERAPTSSSLGRSSYDMGTPPPFPGSGRNSTSTTGRASLGGLLNMARFRGSSEPHSPRYGSPGTNSKSNSFAMSREALVVPEREEGDTPGRYLERLEAAVARSMIAGILSKSADPFAQAVLRSYTRRFPFFGEPIDMSLRKFLLEAELPKETQQVDRVIQAFADRYHECNPGIFVSSDQAYVIAFSLMMLHTDAFNKNNKRKMQKQDYVKNTSGQQVADEVLGCFYDNICYTPFVHYEEEVDINGERVLPFKPKKSKLKGAISESGKKPPSGPVDPYNLLVDQKLHMLRPPIQDSITLEDPYNCRSNQSELDPHYLQRAFTHTGVLQIISQRSRPTAYEGQFTIGEPPNLNPMEMQPGIIDLKITKVGTLWRKATKKKKARSPWQEWGAILTGSQLYLFRNAHWAKSLMNQFLAAQRLSHPRIPVVFKPPLQEFKPDALIKTDNSVALVDSTYTRHKNAFTFVGPGGHEEVFLADNESELHDWLALINYAAAFRAAGVRIRGMMGGPEEKDIRRLDSSQSARSAQVTGGELGMQIRGLSPQLQRQVMAARRQIMVQKVGETTKEIAEANRQLDHMVRNARHLLILAPIAPRTREDMIHAAARMDAMIKWTRRDIWRMKSHKDILVMDVQQDGVHPNEIEAPPTMQIEPPEIPKKSRARDLLRLNSKASAVKSPPRSPTSPEQNKRASGTGSLGTYTEDIFKTPPESATQETEGQWRLPPLQLDVQRADKQRGSVTSTLLTASSHTQSVSRTTSTSSARRVESQAIDGASEGVYRDRKPSSTSIEDADVEMLARTNTPAERLGPINSRGMNVETSTPESSKHRSGVRRSLQKTLRDAHPYSGSVHKHKKGKESDSTVRSAGRENEVEDQQDGTPGLKREKNRFILHGKQASVVQFGNQWPDERMKQRREAWRQNSGSPRDEQPTPRAFGYWGRADVFSQDFNAYQRDNEETPPTSAGTIGTNGLRQDAEAAEAYARSASPMEMTSDSEHDEFATPTLEAPQGPKQGTAIGHHTRKLSLQKGDDGNVVSATDDDDDESEGVDNDDTPVASKTLEKRSTVIGPARLNGHSNGSAASTRGGAEEESDDGSVNDDELSHASQRQAVEVA